MPHLFRAGQGANEHSLEAELHKSKRVGEKGQQNSKEMKNENLTFLHFLFLIMQPP